MLKHGKTTLLIIDTWCRRIWPPSLSDKLTGNTFLKTVSMSWGKKLKPPNIKLCTQLSRMIWIQRFLKHLIGTGVRIELFLRRTNSELEILRETCLVKDYFRTFCSGNKKLISTEWLCRKKSRVAFLKFTQTKLSNTSNTGKTRWTSELLRKECSWWKELRQKTSFGTKRPWIELLTSRPEKNQLRI